VEDEDRELVHSRADLGESVRIVDAPQVDRIDLGREVGMELAE
jgi:hypothetical protein